MRIMTKMYIAATCLARSGIAFQNGRVLFRRPGVSLLRCSRSYSNNGNGDSVDYEATRAAAIIAAATIATTSNISSNQEENEKRPSWAGVIDKETTGAESLRQKLGDAKADGRGVTICILDTGVDPAAPGLSITSSGETKIIDCIDATGAGDVDTSTVVKAIDGYVTGITGRKLPADVSRWKVDGKPLKNPSEFRIGAKRSVDLWPRAVRERLARDLARDIDQRHNTWLAEARAATVQVSSKNKLEKAEADAKLAQLEIAKKELGPTATSVAPVLDVLVWEDPEKKGLMRGVVFESEKKIDTDQVHVLSDMAQATRLNENSSRFSRFNHPKDSLLTYSLSFYDQGRTTSIVVPSGDHGTHVSGIAAAYSSESDELCGVAPGAKIISVKIGDSRLGTMETSTAMARAIVAVRRSGAQIINLSYGEASSLCDAGAFAKKAAKLAFEGDARGVLFISSAGNNGPGLSTVGAPGGTTNALLSIAAYVTPEMRRDLYVTRKLDEKKKGIAYSFSSRGPATDGGAGVCVAAPGGAIASVPRYVLQPKRLMHGTSMSAPNAAGSIACLISAVDSAIDKKIPVTTLRRYIEATAVNPEDLSATDVGSGILAINEAYEAICKAAEIYTEDLDVRYEIRVPERAAGSGAPSARGIYLREPYETCAKTDISVHVVPRFHDDNNVSAERKANFARNVRLTTDAPDWLECGDRMILTYAGKAITVTVDPTKLDFDSLHTARILGFDADTDLPLFSIPVTVIKPKAEIENVISVKNIALASGEAYRSFLTPPNTARSATLTITLRDDDTDTEKVTKRLIHISTLQLLPQSAYSTLHLHKRVWMAPGDTVHYEVNDVAPDKTMELCLSQDWNSLENSLVSARIEYKADGLAPEGLDALILRGTRSVAEVELGCPSTEQTTLIAAPSGKLSKWRRPLRPISSTLKPYVDADRDAFDGVIAYELSLDYEWTHPTANTGSSTVIRMAGDDQIYEAAIEGQHTRVYAKKSGKTLGFRDARSLTDIKGFEPGETYRATVVLRHDDPKTLENFRHSECWIEWSLKSDLAPRCFGTRQGAYLSNGNKFKDVKLKPGETRACFFAPPEEKNLPKELLPGDILLGSITFGRSTSLSLGAQRRRSRPIWYYAPPKQNKESNSDSFSISSKASSSSSESSGKSGNNSICDTDLIEENVTEEEESDTSLTAVTALLDASVYSAATEEKQLTKLATAAFDCQLDYLKQDATKLELSDSEFAAVAANLERAMPDRILDVRRVLLRRACAVAAPAWKSRGDLNISVPMNASHADAVLVAALNVLKSIDISAVATILATRATDAAFENLPGTAESKKERTAGEEQYKAFLEALRWTAEAKLARCLEDSSLVQDFDEALAKLDKWVDTKKSGRLHAQYHRLHDRPGLALAALSTWLNDSKNGNKKHLDDIKEAHTLRADLYEQLGWKDWADAERKRLLDDIPPSGLTP